MEFEAEPQCKPLLISHFFNCNGNRQHDDYNTFSNSKAQSLSSVEKSPTINIQIPVSGAKILSHGSCWMQASRSNKLLSLWRMKSAVLYFCHSLVLIFGWLLNSNPISG